MEQSKIEKKQSVVSPKASIYTKKGDKGKTQLYTGQKIDKYHPVFHAMGKLDLLNSQLGVIYTMLGKAIEKAGELMFRKYDPIINEITMIQEWIIQVCSCIATPRLKSSEERKKPLKNSLKKKVLFTRFCSLATVFIEESIDSMDQKLPKLNQFIIPGGNETSSAIHVARAMCREAERYLFELQDENKNAMAEDHCFVEPNVSSFVNRLSDYLFTLARYIDMIEKTEPNNRSLAKKSIEKFRHVRTKSHEKTKCDPICQSCLQEKEDYLKKLKKKVTKYAKNVDENLKIVYEDIDTIIMSSENCNATNIDAIRAKILSYIYNLELCDINVKLVE